MNSMCAVLPSHSAWALCMRGDCVTSTVHQVAFFASMGWLADFPDSERLPLLDEVRLRLTADEYRRQWETYVYWTRLATKI